MSPSRNVITLGCMMAFSATASLAQETPSVWQTTDFKSPESVLWDPAGGVFYVSNMGVDPMAKDGDGTIARMSADGVVENMAWASGLDAPKGMALANGHLYTADIDQLVEIDPVTGAIQNRYPATGAVLLNDVAAGPDGKVYVSDTFSNSIWVFADGAMSMMAQDPALQGANGLVAADGVLYVADLGDVSQGFENAKPGWVVQIDLASGAITDFSGSEPVGLLDGLASDGAGGFLMTDYASGRIMHQLPGGAATEVARLTTGSADMDYAAGPGLIVVPVTPEGRVVALSWTP